MGGWGVGLGVGGALWVVVVALSGVLVFLVAWVVGYHFWFFFLFFFERWED